MSYKWMRMMRVLIVMHHVYIAVRTNDFADVSEETNEEVIFKINHKYSLFTAWNALLQLFYFVCALLLDFMETRCVDFAVLQRLRRFNGTIFVGLILPSAMFTTITFWAVYLYDRNLIIPHYFDPYFPLWLNHSLHTTPLVFAFYEMLSTKHALPEFASGLIALAILMGVYYFRLFFIYFSGGVFLYSFLEFANTWWLRIFIILNLYLCNLIYYCVAYVLCKSNNKKMSTK